MPTVRVLSCVACLSRSDPRLPDYDQYYASLAATAAPSAQDTPALTSLSEFGEEEEDVKPNVQYLDSLNDYRKRSRSAEDTGHERGPSKTPKLNGHAEVNGFAQLVPEPEPELVSIEEPAAEGAVDDPVVYGECPRLSPVARELTPSQ